MSFHVQHNREHELSLLFHETINILSPSLGQKELLSEPDPHPEVTLLPVTSTHAQTCAHAQLFLQRFFPRLYLYQNNEHGKIQYECQAIFKYNIVNVVFFVIVIIKAKFEISVI